MSYCVVCFRRFETNGISPSENVGKVFTACSQYLKQSIFPKCWNDLCPSEKNYPFCLECFASGKKLSSLCHQLDQVQKEIDNFVQYFSAEIQRYRINEEKTDDQDATQKHYEIIPIANVIVKQENDYHCENAEDFTFHPFSLPVSPHEEEVVLKTERYNALCSDTEEDNEEAKTETQLCRVIIPQQRQQYDLNGELITKAPPKANNRKAISTSSDEASSDDDSDYNLRNDSGEQLRRRTKRMNIGEIDTPEYDECGSSFSRKENLEQGVLRKHGDDVQTFECGFCFSQYKVENEFKRHLKLHSRPFACKICGLTFGADGEERYFGCNQYDYEIHCLEHREEIPFQCQLCLQVFSNTKNYAHHHRAGCLVSPTPFNCQLCEKAFKYEYLLLIHQMDHREDPYEDAVECVICQKPFLQSRNDFKEKIECHYLIVHTGEFPLSCDICGMPLRYITELESHRQCHKPNIPTVIGNILNCPYCELTFKWSTSLKNHIIREHDFSPQIFRCNFCSKEFKIRREFNRHVKMHKEDFKCEICHTILSSNQKLKLHIRTHTGERPRPFRCQQCMRDFYDRRTYRKHLNSEFHRNYSKMKNKCSICFKGYKSEEFLERHRKRYHQPTT